jgi:hypothetical protein
VGIDELEKSGNIFMIPNIGGFTCDFTAGFSVEFLHRFVDVLLLTAADRYLRSVREHQLRDGSPDSTRSSGNKTDFVGHAIRIRPAPEMDFRMALPRWEMPP